MIHIVISRGFDEDKEMDILQALIRAKLTSAISHDEIENIEYAINQMKNYVADKMQ